MKRKARSLKWIDPNNLAAHPTPLYGKFYENVPLNDEIRNKF